MLLAGYAVAGRIGGLIPAYETARHLGAPAIWVEREDGKFRLRRFEVEKGARVVIIEDIVTTGLSIRETVDCMRALGAEVVAAACLIDRSAGKADIGVPLIALAEYEVPAYPADALPPELAAIPAVIFYNKLSSDADRISAGHEAFADEFATILSRQVEDA